MLLLVLKEQVAVAGGRSIVGLPGGLWREHLSTGAHVKVVSGKASNLLVVAMVGVLR